MEIGPAGSAVKIVELMGSQDTDVLSQEFSVLRISRELDVAETPQFFRLISPSVDDVRHLPGVPFHILHRGVKIHETTALRQTGEAVFQAIPDFLSHGDVL